MYVKFLYGIVVAIAMSLIAACSGSGSNSSDVDEGNSESVGNEEPKLGLPQGVTLRFEAVKRFRFDWIDAEGATHYRLLENPDGRSGFSPAGTEVGQGIQTLVLEVPLYARANAQYILQACKGVEAQETCNDSEILSVSGTLVGSIGYFKASNPDPLDHFGSALSLSADGSTLAVGAFDEAGSATGVGGDQDKNDAEHAGAVYVFSRRTGIWVQEAYLKASSIDVYDIFGESLSLSADGNTLAVGAFGEDSSATGVDGDQSNNDARSSGAVYVFNRRQGRWSQQAYIKASNTDRYDNFGEAVHLSADGNILAVGAPFESSSAVGVGGDQSNNDAEGAGAVYLFSRSEEAWEQESYVKASNTEAFDHFGAGLSLSGDGKTLAVWARGEDSNAIGVDGDQLNNDSGSGAVYLFIRGDSTWVQQAYVKASNTDTHDGFGRALSLSGDGDTLAVGAPGEDSSATGLSSDQSNNDAESAGAVYIFSRNAGTWSQQTYVKASNTDTGDRFGHALSLSGDGNILAVTASDEDSNAIGIGGDQFNNSAGGAGAVYLFYRREGSWAQQAYLKASNTDRFEYFGESLNLSADGNTLAVGAIFEDSSATGVNGNQSNNDLLRAGAVYVY
ncbi:histidine kinase [Microbulbifer discodermiae]|uniref:histidine kinase n=1 Tax=Microbulbifer sp. 2201CG32-9 TaxID=3232309 RepID=UPI00345C5329